MRSYILEICFVNYPVIYRQLNLYYEIGFIEINIEINIWTLFGQYVNDI